MAVYTELSVDEVAAFFRVLGLGLPRSVRGITTGIENTNYFVNTEAGEYVLTLFERLTFEELPFYLHLMKHLAAPGLPVPDPVANVRGEILHSLKGRPAVVVNRLPGESVTAPTVSQCRTVGEILARMHVAGSDYPRHQVNPRGLEWWDEVAPVVGRCVSEKQRSLLISELAFQKEIAASPSYEQLPKGPVHADLFRDNALFDGEHLTGVFDFYFAGCDAFLFDIAVCLNDWCVDDCTGGQRDDRAAAFLGGYESVRALTPAERTLLPAMQRAGAFRFWLSRLWDLHQPREAALLKAHDPSHFERVLRVLRGGSHEHDRTDNNTEDGGIMAPTLESHVGKLLSQSEAEGLYKRERVITSPQSSEIEVGGRKLLNFCANNYLGLADSEELRDAAKSALDRYGYGMASVRFICGTQEEHKQLEATISKFLGMEDTILYGSCFDANGGLFETLLSEEDAVISDALNHASIIDGVRLSKAKRFRYANNDMAALEEELKKAEGSRFKLIATDGVFSMDGIIANLKGVCDLAEKYDAMVMVDDSHAVGFVGKNGRGSAEHCGVEGKVDIITGTLGKALGGASGGYTSGKREVVEWLRQRSRPYLFSNTLMPAIAGASIKVFELVRNGDALRKGLYHNADRFRSKMMKLGFTLAGGDHPIIPVMIGDAALASQMADMLLDRDIYVIGFSFPVVPKGQARIRTQMSAAHSPDDIDRAVAAFGEVGRELGVIG